jgi:hypothetical protein
VFSGDLTLDESTLADATMREEPSGPSASAAARPSMRQGHAHQPGSAEDRPRLQYSRARHGEVPSRLNGDFDVKGSGGGQYPLSSTPRDARRFRDIPRADARGFQFTTNSREGDAHIVANGEFMGSIRRRFPATPASRDA